MIFSNKFSKFGKGKNVSAFMPTKTSINIYFYNKGILLKNVSDTDGNYALNNLTCNLPYNAVIEFENGSFLTRLDKSIGIYIDE